MNGGSHGRRGIARIAAVQALYQIDFTDAVPSAVIEEFSRHRFADPGGDDSQVLDKIDAGLFADIVGGAAARRADLDAMIAPLLATGWRIERIDPVLRACLRAGAYELAARGDVPARVAISEYVAVARRFFGGPEPGMVNALLDQLARKLRPTEFGDAGSGTDG